MVCKHGFAILPSGFSSQYLKEFCQHLSHLDLQERHHERSPYDKTHFSFNGHPQLDKEMYGQIFACEELCEALHMLTPHWWIGTHGGDKVTGGSKSHQLLHSDWPQYSTTSMDHGFALAVSLAVHDVDENRAAIRAVPWSNPGWADVDHHGCYADCFEGERAGFYLKLKKGDLLIRDVRAAHAGSENQDYRDRVLPGVTICHPWTRRSDVIETAATNEKKGIAVKKRKALWM